ncbi:sigma-70 family RNA polymerase sigma factor [Aliifodinibius sp. S!AR15-10]|uniref:RNA polymerase sigma factor n=1 Tax=Aliifodinibius sp. S!AR15-10 TaxID=2950437 RepID=UPI0028550078|nr:sigma-70 family RNA polymerase sigma factor [Aliifodinibius sp. S!AR15-10]MDR8390380.1 sigma-70 family RNA polymerase sigma factor [Aliifodinibius sp. S!AR15-10]
MDQVSFSEDIKLWERLLTGDKSALSELFKKYYSQLLSYGLKLVSDRALVKDSIQELFYSIWEQRDNLSEVEYIRSYLYVSLRRAIYRQAEIKQNRHDRDRAYSEEFFQHVINHEKLMIQEELKEEQKRELKRGLDLLNKREKEALFLKFYSGLTNAEIAQVMEVNRQSVYNNIYRAIQSLKSFLDE